MTKIPSIVSEIYRHRIRVNKTQTEMAETLGVSLATYNALERGRGKPSKKTLTKISLLLDGEGDRGK